MQTGQESGCEFLDPRSLTWEQRYALSRRAVQWAHDERSRAMASLVRRLWSWVSRAGRPDAGATGAKTPVGAAPCRS